MSTTGQPYQGPLMGVPPGRTVAASETLSYVETVGFPYCFHKCIYHFGDDAIPYHPGEKTCMDRCINKLVEGMEMARPISLAYQDVKLNFNSAKVKCIFLKHFTCAELKLR